MPRLPISMWITDKEAEALRDFGFSFLEVRTMYQVITTEIDAPEAQALRESCGIRYCTVANR